MTLIILPVTFGVIKYFEERYHRDTEIKLADRAEKHDVRLKYLTIALQPNKSDEQSERVLRFLVNIEDDTTLSGWAQKELRTVQERISKADSLQKKLDTACQQITNIQYEKNLINIRYANQNKESRKQIEELNIKLEAANKEKNDLLAKGTGLYSGSNLFTSGVYGSGISAGSYLSRSIIAYDSNYNPNSFIYVNPHVNQLPSIPIRGADSSLQLTK